MKYKEKTFSKPLDIIAQEFWGNINGKHFTPLFYEEDNNSIYFKVTKILDDKSFVVTYKIKHTLIQKVFVNNLTLYPIQKVFVNNLTLYRIEPYPLIQSINKSTTLLCSINHNKNWIDDVFGVILDDFEEMYIKSQMEL